MDNASLARAILMTAWNALIAPSAQSAVRNILSSMTKGPASVEEVVLQSSTRLQIVISVFVKQTSYLRPRDV